MDIEQNLQTVLADIAETAKRWDRPGDAVTLVAVSKVFPADHIEPALRAGHRVFGENKVQEALEKWPDLKKRYEGVSLHLIGPLQTNKVAKALDIFDVIETVDRPKLAGAIARLSDKLSRRPPCYVQVNTGAEAQKAGIPVSEADQFIQACQKDYGLNVTGVMCIPPVAEEPAPHFALLKKIADHHGLENCSMGMSSDYPIAIQFGASHVRVGSAIFGQRPKPLPAN